jgi:hypothetical protein
VQARDSVRLREDMALLSCLRPSELLVKSNLPNPNSPRQREKQNNVTSEIRNITYIHKCLDISKEYLFIYMATRPEF